MQTSHLEGKPQRRRANKLPVHRLDVNFEGLAGAFRDRGDFRQIECMLIESLLGESGTREVPAVRSMFVETLFWCREDMGEGREESQSWWIFCLCVQHPFNCCLVGKISQSTS
jgi:hypothetical protein